MHEHLVFWFSSTRPSAFPESFTWLPLTFLTPKVKSAPISITNTICKQRVNRITYSPCLVSCGWIFQLFWIKWLPWNFNSVNLGEKVCGKGAGSPSILFTLKKGISTLNFQSNWAFLKYMIVFDCIFCPRWFGGWIGLRPCPLICHKLLKQENTFFLTE